MAKQSFQEYLDAVKVKRRAQMGEETYGKFTKLLRAFWEQGVSVETAVLRIGRLYDRR